MRIVTRIADLADHNSRSTGFVPTLGALHEGHLSLMRTARGLHDRVVISVFVNPTQFGSNEDFAKYPRDLDRDAAMASSVGVDVLFAPSFEEMYSRRPATTVQVPELTEAFEGLHRPGHFTGVSTVVCKLFNIVRPKTAYFGLKDLQQCMVIRRMVEDLNMGVELTFLPTVREPDGLAMSSRNVFLSREDRQKAPVLFAELTRLRDEFKERQLSSHDIREALARSTIVLSEAGFEVSYLELIELANMSATEAASGESAIIAAAKLGTTRLIDNVVL